MTQYLKHRYVDAIDSSIVLTDTNTTRTGKTHPAVIGLNIEYQIRDANGIDYCLSTAPTDSNTDVLGVEVLDAEQWKNEWLDIFNSVKQTSIKNIYEMYKDKFASLPDSYYHPYEMLYSSFIKKTEAMALNSSMTLEQSNEVAPVLSKEASLRGIDVFYLAEKVLAHSTIFDNSQAELLAQRGKDVDTIYIIECDATSVETIRESILRLHPQIN
jgi:hypothetical protein